MQANWDKKYLTQVGYISHVNAGWKVPHLGEVNSPTGNVDLLFINMIIPDVNSGVDVYNTNDYRLC